MSKVAREVAQAEFERWADVFEIDTTTEDMSDKELEAFNAFKIKFIRRVETGVLLVDGDGTLELSPRGGDGKLLKFNEPTGAVLSARKINDTDFQAVRRVLAMWTGAPPKRFADMKLRDFNFCTELLAFFGSS